MTGSPSIRPVKVACLARCLTQGILRRVPQIAAPESAGDRRRVRRAPQTDRRRDLPSRRTGAAPVAGLPLQKILARHARWQVKSTEAGGLGTVESP